MPKHLTTLLLAFCLSVTALPSLIAEGETPSPRISASSKQALMTTITEIVREQIPHQYEDTSKWGMTTEVWDGLHIRREGLKIKTKRRKKEVNHGAWTLYRIELIDPQHEFQMRVENERELAGGGVAFDLVVNARLHLFGRRSRWVKGLQLASLSADADARVQLRLGCHLVMSLDITKLPPDVVLHPHVDAAKLDITYFRVDRISEVGGTIAKELGRGIERILQKQVDKKRDRLVEKANAAIERRSDKLRISLQELLASQWAKLANHLPEKPAETKLSE